MPESSHAYNSVWQLRGDAWCRLEEAADRLSRPATLKDRYVIEITEASALRSNGHRSDRPIAAGG